MFAYLNGKQHRAADQSWRAAVTVYAVRGIERRQQLRGTLISVNAFLL